MPKSANDNESACVEEFSSFSLVSSSLVSSSVGLSFYNVFKRVPGFAGNEPSLGIFSSF